MREITKEELKEAKVYFGHRTFKWNPKFKPYIYKSQFGIHFIDIEKTKTYLDKARQYVNKMGREGKKILWVGTKKQASSIVKEYSDKTNCNYVNYRWIAGILTNFATISSNLDKMTKIEEVIKGEDQERTFTKKELSIKKREYEKLHRNYAGLKNMNKLPDLVFIVDADKEKIALRESKKLKIPVMAIADTNVDPTKLDHIIPANDDSIKSIEFIIKSLVEAYMEGYEYYKKKRDDDIPEDVLKEEEVKEIVDESDYKEEDIDETLKEKGDDDIMDDEEERE